MESKWQEICYLMKKNELSSEDLFQSEIISIFEKLGWSRFNEDIEEKRKINVGASKSLIPDIIIKDKTKDLFVIELKKPSRNYTRRDDSQLFSYLRQLKLNIGLLINDRIHVFYEDNNCQVPVEIMNIEFDEEAEDGLMFVKLFSKQTYDNEALINYCRNQLESLNAIDYLTSEEFRSKIYDFIREDSVKLFSKEVVEIALDNIGIDVTNEVDNNEIRSHMNQITDNSQSEREKEEIEKVKRRVPRWLNKPNQKNSMILIAIMEHLFTEERVSFNTIKQECRHIDKFHGNFEQMANFGERNHAKVFERNGDVLSLWEPVKSFLRQSYSIYKTKK